MVQAISIMKMIIFDDQKNKNSSICYSTIVEIVRFPDSIHRFPLPVACRFPPKPAKSWRGKTHLSNKKRIIEKACETAKIEQFYKALRKSDVCTNKYAIMELVGPISFRDSYIPHFPLLLVL